MEQSNLAKMEQHMWNDLEAIMALDLTNAYGLFHRSGALKEVREHLPKLLGMVKSQWQTGESIFWMRVNGQWQRSATQRGGYQGLRLVTILFCCALRRSMRLGLEEQAIMKPKYQDDSYLVGKLTAMADAWEALT
eukprot:10542066-Karenia_brevis.AAC.1